MVSSVEIYEAIKEIIPTDLPTKFNYINLSNVVNEKTEVISNTLAIYVRTAGNGIRDIVGTYRIETARIVFNLYSGRGSTGVLFGEEYCKRICDSLDSCYNKIIQTERGELCILQFNREGRPYYVGPTEQGIAVFSINYTLKYSGN